MYSNHTECLQVWHEIYQLNQIRTVPSQNVLHYNDHITNEASRWFPGSEWSDLRSLVRHFFNLGFHLPPNIDATKQRKREGGVATYINSTKFCSLGSTRFIHVLVLYIKLKFYYNEQKVVMVNTSRYGTSTYTRHDSNIQIARE